MTVLPYFENDRETTLQLPFEYHTSDGYCNYVSLLKNGVITLNSEWSLNVGLIIV